jgi:hypothetical protein
LTHVQHAWLSSHQYSRSFIPSQILDPSPIGAVIQARLAGFIGDPLSREGVFEVIPELYVENSCTNSLRPSLR